MKKSPAPFARFLVVVVTALLSAVVLAQSVGGSVVIAINAEPDSLDPQKSATAVVNQVMRYIGDTLVSKDLNGNYIPGLATSWTPSDDDKVWTFTLRENVLFHDGTPLDAKAVETSLLRQFDTSHPLYNESMVYREIVFAEVASIAATADLDLTITLNRPITLLPANLAVFAAGSVVKDRQGAVLLADQVMLETEAHALAEFEV